MQATAGGDRDATKSGKWTTIFRSRRRARGKRPLPKNSPMKAVSELELKGIPDADPNLINDYKADGEWAVVKGTVQQVSGSGAALSLGSVGEFELEGFVDAGGVGGWFILVGWNDGHGYILYNVQLKTSGSPWKIAEVRGNKMVPETHEEVTRYAWGGPLKMQLSVRDGELTLTAGRAKVAEKIPLENYSAGELIIGTYSCQYGPKKLRLGSMRIRSLEEDSASDE